MVRNNLKVALFLLVSVAFYFFVFQNQLLHPPTLPPVRVPQKHDTNNNTTRYYIEGGIVFGTVLKSPNNAKTTILSLANRLIEGYVIKDASDWLTLAVFDVFGAIDEHEMEMIEDERKIKIIIFSMQKSYDPCLILTENERESAQAKDLINDRLLSLYTADFIKEVRQSIVGKTKYFHLLYNTIDMKDKWNTLIESTEEPITPFGINRNVAGFMISQADLSNAEKNMRNKVFSASVKQTLSQDMSVQETNHQIQSMKMLDIVAGSVAEDAWDLPIELSSLECEAKPAMPWPQPTSIEHNTDQGETRVMISPTIGFYINDQAIAVADVPEWFRDSLSIWFAEISSVQHIPPFEDEDIDSIPDLTAITFVISGHADKIPFGDNEQYEISMENTGRPSIEIKTPSVFGALRAMQTISQLVQRGRGFNYIANFPISIEDKPKFPHRGLLLDTAREYYKTDTIKSIVKFLGANKLNVLHWHMTDDHAFSVECKKYPGLAKGSVFGGPHYTQEEVKEIVELATTYGVRVIPEIGGPAHAGSWINDYHPHTISNCPSFSCKNAWGITLNPTLNDTYAMLQNFFNEMAALFPDPYMHFGGDETLFECWKQDGGISKWMEDNHMKGDYKKLLQRFETKFAGIASSIKKKGIRWEEVWWHPNFELEWPVVAVWVNKPSKRWMTPILDAGYDVSFLSYNGWYLNHNAGGVGCQTWEECYDNKPFDLELGSDLWSRALGGSASGWEMSDAHFTGRDLWLRTIIVAESLWVEETTVIQNRRTKNEKVLPRLKDMCRHLQSTVFSGDVYKERHPCWHLTEKYTSNKSKIDGQLLREYSVREAQRDDLICTRVKNHFNPPNKQMLTCGTKNCIRENIGTTHHETQG